MKKLQLLFFFFFFFALTIPSQAACRKVCSVCYATNYGWSKKYTVEVTFLTGSELNDATSSFKYSSYSVYAVIFWGEGKASVIKISNYLICGSEVDCSCIDTYGSLKGSDQDGDDWKICTNDICF